MHGFTIGDFVCLMFMKNRKTEKTPKEKKEPFRRVLRILFTNKGFLCAIVVHVIWSVSVYMTVGFMGVYKTKDLLLSVGASVRSFSFSSLGSFDKISLS